MSESSPYTCYNQHFKEILLHFFSVFLEEKFKEVLLDVNEIVMVNEKTISNADDRYQENKILVSSKNRNAVGII